MPTKDELEAALAKAEKKIAKLEAELGDLQASMKSSVPVDADRVFGPDAVPLEQR